MLFSNSDYSISASYEVVVGSGDDKNATQTASISVNAHFTFTEKNLLFPDESVSVSLSLGGGSVTAKSDKQEIETISYSCSATKPEGNPYATAAGLGSASESSIHGSFYGYIYDKSLELGGANIEFSMEPQLNGENEIVSFTPVLKINGIIQTTSYIHTGSRSFSFSPTVIE